MNSRLDYKVEDLLKDDTFICYILDVSSETDSNWSCFLKNHPELAKKAQEAKSVLLGCEPEYRLPADELEQLKRRIFDSVGIYSQG